MSAHSDDFTDIAFFHGSFLYTLGKREEYLLEPQARVCTRRSLFVDTQRGIQPREHTVIEEQQRSKLTMLLGPIIGGKSHQGFQTRECLIEHLGLAGKEMIALGSQASRRPRCHQKEIIPFRGLTAEIIR